MEAQMASSPFYIPWEFTKLPAFLPQVKSQVGNTPFPPFHRTGPGLGGSHQLQIFHKWKETQLGPYDLRPGRPWFCLVLQKNRWNKRIASRSDHQRTSSPGHLSKKIMLSLGPLRSVEMNFLISNRSCHVQVRTGVHNCVHSTATQGCSWRRPRCNNFGILAAGAV